MNNTFSIEDYVNGSIGGSSPITFTDVTKVRNYLVEQPKLDAAPGYGFFDWTRDAASAIWRGAQESDMKNDQDRMAFANYAIDNAESALEAEEDEELFDAIDGLRKAGVWSENRDPDEQDLLKIIEDQKKQFEESQKSYFENKQEYDDSLNNYDISQWYTRRSNDAVLNWGNWMYKMPTTMGTSWSAFDKQLTSMAGTIIGSAIGSAGTGALLGSSVAPGIGTAIGTAVGAITGAVAGQFAGGIEARKQESHMEAFMGYSEKVKDLAEKSGVNLSVIADNTKQQLNERGIDTSNMTNDMLIEYALSDRSIQTGSTQFNEIADKEFAASRRVYDRNNALGLGEVVSDLSYVFPIRRWGGNMISKLFSPVTKGAKKLVPNALRDGLNLRFSKGLEIAAAGAIARNRTIAKDAWGFVKDSMFRGVIEGTEEGAQAMIVDEYKAGKYDNEYANEDLPDVDDIQSWTDLGETIGLRAKALSAWVGLNDEYKDDQQMSEEMWSGFLLSMINPQGLMIGGPQVAVRLNTLMQLPKVSSYLQQSLEKQDAIARYSDYFKNLREGLPSGRTWNEALDIIAEELKSVKADGKTRNYNLDPLVLTDGQTMPTNKDVDDFISEQKEDAEGLSTFYKAFQKTLNKNNISVPEEDKDLYAALTLAVRSEKAANDLNKNRINGLKRIVNTMNINSDKFKTAVEKTLKTKTEKTDADYNAISAINDLNSMLDYLVDHSSSTPNKQLVKQLLKQNGYLSQTNALDDAKIELAYQELAEELIKERDSLIEQFKKYHEDIDEDTLRSMDLLSEDPLFLNQTTTIAKNMSDALVMEKLLTQKEEQYNNPTQSFVEEKVQQYKDMLNRQRALADNANAAARSNTEPTVTENITENVTDMTNEAVQNEKTKLEESVTSQVNQLDLVLHSIPQGSHLRSLVDRLDKTSEFVKDDPLKYARHMNLLIKRLKYQYDRGEGFESASEEDKKKLEEIVKLADNVGTKLDQILRLNTESKAKAVRHNAGLLTTLSNSRIWRDENGNEYVVSREDIEYSENEGAIITLKPVAKQGLADEISKTLEQLREKIAKLEKNPKENEKQIKALKSVMDSLTKDEADVRNKKIIVNAETARPWLEKLSTINNKGEVENFKESNDGLDSIVKYVNKKIEANKKTRNERANMAFANSDPFDFLLNDATRREEKKANPKHKLDKVKFKRGGVRTVKTYALKNDNRSTSEILNPHHGAKYWFGYFTMIYSDPRDVKEKFGERNTFTRDHVTYDRSKAAETYYKIGKLIADAKQDKTYKADEVYEALERLFKGSKEEKILGQKITSDEYWNMVYATPFQQFLMSKRTGKQRVMLVMHDLGSVSKFSDYSNEEREARAEFVHTMLNKFKVAKDKSSEDIEVESYIDVSAEEFKPDNEYSNRFYFGKDSVRIIPNDFNYNTSSVRNENSKLFLNEDGTSMNNSEVNALYDNKTPAAVQGAKPHLDKILQLLHNLNYDKVTEDILNQMDEANESNLAKLVKGVLKYGDGVITANTLTQILRDTCGTLKPGTKHDPVQRAKDLFEMFAEIIPEHFISYYTAAQEGNYSSYPVAESVRAIMNHGYFKNQKGIKIFLNDSTDATNRTPVNLTLNTKENVDEVVKVFQHMQRLLEQSRTASEFIEDLKKDYTFIQTGSTAIAERTLREYFNFVKFGRLSQNGNLAQVFSTGKASPNDEYVSYEGFDRHTVHNQKSLLDVESLGIIADEDGKYHFSIEQYVEKNAPTSATTPTGTPVETEFDIKKEQKLGGLKKALEAITAINLMEGGKKPTTAALQEFFVAYSVITNGVIDEVKERRFKEKDGKLTLRGSTLNQVVYELTAILREEIDKQSTDFLAEYADDIIRDVKKDESFDGRKHSYVHFAVGSFRTKDGVSVIYKDNNGQPHPLPGANGTPGAIYLVLPGFFSPSGERQHVKLNPQRVDQETATFIATMLQDVSNGKLKMDTVLTDTMIGKYHVKSNATVKTILDQLVFNGTDAITNDPEADHNFEYFLHVDAANRVNFGNSNILDDTNFDQFVEFLMSKPRRIDMNKITDINALNGVDLQVSFVEEGETKTVVSRNRFKNYVATVLEEGLLKSDLAAGKSQKIYSGAAAYTSFEPSTTLKTSVANSATSEGSAKKAKIDRDLMVSMEEVRQSLSEENALSLATLSSRTPEQEMKRFISSITKELNRLAEQGIIDTTKYDIGIYTENGKFLKSGFSVSYDKSSENVSEHGFTFDASQRDFIAFMYMVNESTRKKGEKPKRLLLHILDKSGNPIKLDNKRIGGWLYFENVVFQNLEQPTDTNKQQDKNNQVSGNTVTFTVEQLSQLLASSAQAGAQNALAAMQGTGVPIVQQGQPVTTENKIIQIVEPAPEQARTIYLAVDGSDDIPVKAGLQREEFDKAVNEIEDLPKEELDILWSNYQMQLQMFAQKPVDKQAVGVNVGSAPQASLSGILLQNVGQPAKNAEKTTSSPVIEDTPTVLLPSITELLQWVEQTEGVAEKNALMEDAKKIGKGGIKLTAAYAKWLRSKGMSLPQAREYLNSEEGKTKVRQLKGNYDGTTANRKLALLLKFESEFVEKEDYQEAIQIVKEMLGDLVIKELDVVSKEYDQAREANLYVYGMFTEPAIYIYKQLVEGTEKIVAGGLYHEAYHRVSLFYFSEKDRQKMYAKAREEHPELMDRSDAYVEEWLADEFAARVLLWKKQDVPQKDYSKNTIIRQFQKLFNLIKKVSEYFKKNHLSDDVNLNDVFKKMYAGRYSYARATKHNKELFNKLYEGRVAFSGVKVDNIVIAEDAIQFTEIKRDLIARLINNVGISQLAEGGVVADMSIVHAELMKELNQERANAKLIEEFIDHPEKLREDLKQADVMETYIATTRRIEVYENITKEDAWKIWEQTINDFVKQKFGIPALDANETLDSVEGEKEGGKGNLGYSEHRDSINRDVFEELSISMKALLWSVVDGDISNPASLKFTADGLQVYTKVNELYNKIIRIVTGADSVENMMERLKDAAKLEIDANQDYTLQQFYARLLPDNTGSSAAILRNNVYSAFVRHIHSFQNYVYESEEHVWTDTSGKKHTYYTYQGSVRSGNLDTVSKNIRNSWRRALTVAFTAIADMIVENPTAKLAAYNKPLKDAVKDLLKNRSNPKKELEAIERVLEQLRNLYAIQYKDNDIKKAAKQIQPKLVDALITFLTDKDKGLLNFNASALSEIAGKRKGRFGYQAAFTKLTDFGTPFHYLTEQLASSQTPDAKDNSQPGPKNTKVFSIGAYNFITRLFSTRMLRSPWKKRMQKNIYTAHSQWLQELINGVHPKVNTKFSTVIDNDFRDATADIDVAPHEDLLNRLLTILDGQYNAPSLANKRFAAALLGFGFPASITDVVSNEGLIQDGYVNQFVGYFADEILAIADAMKIRQMFIDKVNEITGKDFTTESFSALNSEQQEELFRQYKELNPLLLMLEKQYHFTEKGTVFKKVGDRIVRRQFHIDLTSGTGYKFRHFQNIGKNIKFTQELINQLTEHIGGDHTARKDAIDKAYEIARGQRSKILDHLTKNVIATLETFMNEGLIQYQEGINPLTGKVNINELRNDMIPTQAFDKIKGVKPGTTKQPDGLSIYRLATYFTIMDSIGSFEFEKLVTGDIAQLKDITAVNKRYSGPVSTIELTAERGVMRNAFTNDRLMESPTYNTLTLNTSLVVNQLKFSNDMMNVLGVDVIVDYSNNGKTVFPIVDHMKLLDENGEFKTPDAPLVKRYISHKNERRSLGLDENGNPLSNEALAKVIVDKAVDNFLNYLNNDPTDAQVFITAEMWRQLMQRNGRWNDKLEACYNLLENYDIIPSLYRTHKSDVEGMCSILGVDVDELLHKAKQYNKDPKKYGNSYKSFIIDNTAALDATSLKYIYFGEAGERIDGLHALVYDKMSLSPIFKIFAEGHQMEQVYKLMSDRNIDLLKMESATKVGGIASFELFDENGNINLASLENAPLQQQYFELLGKQLNTDPHGAGQTALLTQFMKIANMNIVETDDYNVGENTIKGSEVTDLYQKIINDLTVSGQIRFLKSFGITHNDDGSYTIDKRRFMQKLARMGQTQDLPIDTLAAFDVDKDGNYVIHPSAMPNLRWIQSRLISQMGKDVIDTAAPGMPLYQVASVGYDDIFNTGMIADEHLRMPGEDGSKHMEVKLSIKFFYDIIDKTRQRIVSGDLTLDKRYGDLSTFEQQRKFILDNQDLFSLSYRVPTQGQNSTIPIKIVDVFPPQRGGIISFPAGVTAQTGSDFDIDKMFLARYNYTVDKKGRLTKVKYDIDAYRNGEYQSKAQLQNMLLDIYFGVLTAPQHYLAANTPLDVCTAPLSDFAKSVANVGKVVDELPSKPKNGDENEIHLVLNEKKKQFDAYKWDSVKNKFKFQSSVPINTAVYEKKLDLYHTNPVFQTAQKKKNAGSDAGIGPMALNSVFRYFAQIAHLQLSSDKYLNSIGITKIDSIFDRNGVDILDITSALINAHVDAVKDNYIGNVNVNGYTFSTTAFLTSAGFGNDTFAFLTQPILQDLAKKWQRRKKGTVVTDPEASRGQQFFEEVKEEWQDKLSALKSKGDVSVGKARPNEMTVGYLKYAMNNTDTAEGVAQQLRYLNAFQHIYESAQYYSDLINTAQIDTKKYGKSSDEIISFMQRVLQAHSEFNTVFENPQDIFNKTFLGVKWENGVKMLMSAFDQVIFEFSETYQNACNELCKQYGKYGRYSKDFLRIVGPRLRSVFHMPFFNQYLKERFPDSKTPLKALTQGPNSVAARYNAIKQACFNKGIGFDFFDLVTYSPLVADNFPQFFTINDMVKTDETVKNQLQASISELFNSGDESIMEWITDFAVMMFYQTGGTDTNAGGIIKTTVYDLLPPQHLASITTSTYGSYNKFVTDLVSRKAPFTQDQLDQAMMLVALTDDTVVPVIDEKDVTSMISQSYKLGNVSKMFDDVIYVGYKSGNVKLRGQGTFNRFVKVRKQNGDIHLYKLGDIIITQRKSDGKQYASPLYFRVNNLGYRNKSVASYSVRADGSIENGVIKSLMGTIPGIEAQHYSELSEKQLNKMTSNSLFNKYELINIIPAEPVMNYSGYANDTSILGPMGDYTRIDSSDVVYYFNDGYDTDLKNYAEFKHGPGRHFVQITDASDMSNIPVYDNVTVTLIGTYDETIVNNLKSILPTNNKYVDLNGNINSSQVMEKHKWGRYGEIGNSYEVSTAGDARFSALNATFKPGTIIDGVDVGGKTIEYVYQTVIKKSGKGRGPSQTSRLNLNPTNVTEAKRQIRAKEVVSEYGNPVRYFTEDGVINLILEKGSLEIVPFAGIIRDNSGKPLGNKDINYFVGALKLVEDLAGGVQDYSYYEAYLPLWQEWAKQNPELMEELRTKVGNKTLTDKFANTRVSQARALAEILNQTATNKTERLSSDYENIQFVENKYGSNASQAYAIRTGENARYGHVTIQLATDFNTSGEQRTAKSAGNKLVKSDMNKSVDEIVSELIDQLNNKNLPAEGLKINIAGNGIYTFAQQGVTQSELNDKVTAILRGLLDKGIDISEIRSGGQTGIDEAGVIAARRLSIKTSIVAPKGWLFRDKDNKTQRGEQKFKERFKITPEEMAKIGEQKKKDC